MLNIYIGYDHREKEAFDVCKHSILKYCPDANIIPLNHKSLRKQGFFSRPWIIDEEGSFKDMRDERPFSTEFAFTRFLVPHVHAEMGKGQSNWAIFMDCDMLLTCDISKILEVADASKAVMVVKHEYNYTDKPLEAIKMDGCAQTSYNRKNWSSFILWNCNHPANKSLTLEHVNFMSGSWLHAFSWLKDEEIGELTAEWNWLEGHSPADVEPKALHYTRGTPDMAGFENAAYADEWRDVAARINLCKVIP